MNNTLIKNKKANKKETILTFYIRESDGKRFPRHKIPNISSLGEITRGRPKNRYAVDNETYIKDDAHLVNAKRIVVKIKNKEIEAINPNTKANDVFADGIVNMIMNEKNLRPLVNFWQSHMELSISGKPCEQIAYKAFKYSNLRGNLFWDEARHKIKHTKGTDITYIESKNKQLLMSIKGGQISKKGRISYSCHRAVSFRDDIPAIKKMYTDALREKGTHTFIFARQYDRVNELMKTKILSVTNNKCSDIDINRFKFRKCPPNKKTGKPTGYNSNEINGCYFKITFGTSDQLWFHCDNINDFIKNNKASVKVCYDGETPFGEIGETSWV